MIRLLRAGFRRYLRSPIWWIAFTAALFFGVLFGDQAMRSTQLEAASLIYFHLILACLISLTVGREVGERVIRNKIIAGHGKTKILFSELLLALFASLILEILFTTPILIGSIKLLSRVPLYIKMYALIETLLFNVLCVVINVLLAILIHNRAVSAIICILLVLVMALGASEIYTALNQKEFHRTPQFVYNEEIDAHQVIIKEERNPNYVSGTKRHLYLFLLRCSPYGQACVYTSSANDHLHSTLPIDEEHTETLKTGWCYTVGVTAVFITVGVLLFRRRDMK